jgi:hypothetical protein
MPVRHGQTPARRLHLPESEPLWRAGRGFVVRDHPRHLRIKTVQKPISGLNPSFSAYSDGFLDQNS